MKRRILLALLLSLAAGVIHAQVSVNSGGSPADPSAMLDVSSAVKGLLIPRMTLAGRDAIANPAHSLLVYCTDNQQFYYNQGTPSSKNWVMINTQWRWNGTDLGFTAGYVGIGTESPSVSLHVAGNALVTGDVETRGRLTTAASSATLSGLRLPHGTAPTSPDNGDVWTTTGGLFARINGSTVGPLGGGTVTSVTATSPISSTGGTTPDISIPQATWMASGYLTSTDWNMFSNKVTSVSASAPLSSSGGSYPNLTITQSSGSTSGYLSSTDWTTFNGKENVLTFNTPLARSTNTISLPAASASVNGYLSSSDYSRIHGTTGSVLFFDGSGIQQKNGSFFWDNTNNRLGLLTSSPSATLSIGSSSQFQVTSTGSVTVSLSSTSGTINATNSNSSGTGVISFGQGTSAFDQSTPSGGAFKGSTFGVYGEAVYDASGGRFGGYFYTRKSVTESSYAYVGGYLNGTAKTIYGPGYTSLMVSDPGGGNVDMFGEVAPEILINDYGTGQLVNGHCHVSLDPKYSANIIASDEHPLKVFIQPEGDCNGVFVTNKTVFGFDVVEMHGGTSDTRFSFSVVASRKDVLNPDGSVSSRHVGVRFPKSEIK